MKLPSTASLKGRLLMVLVGTVTLAWAGVLLLLFIHTSNDRTSVWVWDSKLQAFGTRILLSIPSSKDLLSAKPAGAAASGAADASPRLRLREDAIAGSGELAFQVWVDRRKLVARTPGAPAEPLRPDFVEGFASRDVGGEKWRIYSVSDSTGRVFVQVGNLHSVIDAEMRRKTFIALGLISAVMALVGLLMWGAVCHSLGGIEAIESAVRGRRKFDLTPLPVATLPTELRPLVDSFNHVLLQLDEAVEGERRFIGDAAHELRTPLSALLAHAQIALRATTLAEKDATLVKLLAVAERSTRLSEQLLDLARLDAGANAPQRTEADLSELIVHVAHEFDIAAEQGGRVIQLSTQPCRIACDVDEIGILLRNLLDNALRYTQAGGRVVVSCGCGAEAPGSPVWLDVSDDGPGVPDAERGAIFDRFHRVAGSGERGSGIGLSLVARIARLHQATIETGTGLDGRGLSVRIVFPAPAGALPSPGTTGDAPRLRPGDLRLAAD